MFAVWQQVFKNQDNIRGFTLSAMLQYYLLIFVITSIVESHFEGLRCQEVRLGKIDFKMIRPFSYLSEILCQDLSSKLIYFLLGTPLFIAMIAIWSPLLNLSSNFSLTAVQFFLFLYFILIGYTLNFLIAFWIVLASFWMEGSQGLEHFKWILVNLFSGMIPLSFLPSWMQQIANILPFKYMLAIPIGVIQNTYLPTWQDLSWAIGSVVIMILVTRIWWDKAVMKYSSAGG
jgi:ABC-2 type transport system permease protein